MRKRCTKLLTLGLLFANLCLVYLTHKYYMGLSGNHHIGRHDPIEVVTPPTRLPLRDRIQSSNRHIKNLVTILFRDVYFFDNDLQASIESILAVVPSIQIVVVYDEEPYPPLDFVANLTACSNVHFVSSAFDVQKTGRTASPLNLIQTRYVFIVPDAFRLVGRFVLQKMLKEIQRKVYDPPPAPSLLAGNRVTDVPTMSSGPKTKSPRPGKLGAPIERMLFVPFGNNARHSPSCCRLNLGIANWTLEYVHGNGIVGCDMYTQKHGIFIETDFLRDMPEPLATPFPEMLYLQAKIANIRKSYFPIPMMDGKRLFVAFHNKKRRKDTRRQQFRDMYKRMQIKRVIRRVPNRTVPPGKLEKLRYRSPMNVAGAGGGEKSGSVVKAIDLSPPHRVQQPPSSAANVTPAAAAAQPLLTTVEYYGCERHTRSCIGTVFNSRPFYAYLGRQTPPCCAEKLKAVVHHVMDELENVGIRYWLDNMALKSAIDTNALAADAFEVDIGFNVFDLERSQSLKKCQERPLTDAMGFHWMKATDGHYFHVQFSKANQVGVNLLPFELQLDRFLPNGFFGWKAKEFNAEFLHPMSSVVFLGKNVACPNNVKEFLAIKNL